MKRTARSACLLPHDDFDVNDLHAFGLIVSAGGISAAARRFQISKATLSRALNRLEMAAGAPLFDRVGKGLRLTPLGQTLVPVANAVLTAARDAEEALRAAHGEPRGPLRIAASAVSGQHLLAPVIAAFARRHPAVQISLRIAAQGPDPLAEDLDVVLRIGRPPEPYLVARRILTAPLRLYAPSARKDDTDLNDPDAVEALGRIVFEVSGVRRAWILQSEDGTTIELTSEPLVAVGDPTVALGILRSGTGLAFLPDLYGESLVVAGEFVRALPSFTGPVVEIYASLPPRRASIPAVRAFLDMLVEHLADMQNPT